MPTGLLVKPLCVVATTANIILSGLSPLNGVTLASSDRVLVKDQSNPIENGIWLAASGAWSRAPDFDGSGDVFGGTLVLVASGTAGAGLQWRVEGEGSVTVGTDPITFEHAYATTISVKDFGAAGDGVTDDTSAFSAAIEWANATGPQDVPAGISQATRIFVPAGYYKIDGAVSAITVSGGVVIDGEGDASVLLLGYDGVCFDFDPVSVSPPYDVSGGLQNLAIQYPEEPGSDACVARFSTTSGTFLRNLRIRNVPTLCRLGDSATRKPASDHIIEDVRGTCSNTAHALIEIQRALGLYLDKTNSVFVEGVSIPTVYDREEASNIPTVAGRYAISFPGYAGSLADTIFVAGTFVCFNRGLSINVDSGIVFVNSFLENAVFDFCGDYAIYANVASGGTLAALKGTAYLNAWNYVAIYLNGEGILADVKLSGDISAAGHHGVMVTGDSVRHLDLSGLTIFGANRLDVDAAGILIFDGPRQFRIRDCSVLYDSVVQWTQQWQPKWGIYIGADLDDFVITENDCRGSTASYVFEANSTASANRRVANNLRANYAGIQTASPYVLPASGTAWTNKTGHAVEITIGGGAVSAIAKNGSALGITSGTLTIQPGDSFTVTYSVTPSATFCVLP